MSDYTLDKLFALEKLPDHIAAWLRGCGDPLTALNRLPDLLADLKGKGVQNHGTIMPGAHVVGDVHIGKGSVIHPGATIEGPVWIGDDVKVSAHALLRDGCYLCDACVVGHGADIKNTLALPGAKIQDGTFAGDSVLGCGARIGSGAILSNRKFNQTSIKIDLGNGVVDSGRDFLGAIMGDQARLGANVTVSPGSVIGAYTWIGSGCVIQGSTPGDRLVTVKQELDIRTKDRTELKSGMGEYYSL